MKENRETKLEPTYNLALCLTLLATPFLYAKVTSANLEWWVPPAWGGVSLLFLISGAGEDSTPLTLTSVPRSWIKLFWVSGGFIITIFSTLVSLGLINSENIGMSFFYLIFGIMTTIGLLSLTLQWCTLSVVLSRPPLFVFFAYLLISLYVLIKKSDLSLSLVSIIGFSQSISLLSCLTGKTGSELQYADPLIPKLIAACVSGFLLMSCIIFFYRAELTTKPGALPVLNTLPVIFSLLTYWGIRAIRPYEKPPE